MTHLVVFEVGSSNDPGRPFARLCRGKHALGDESADCRRAERERGRRFLERCLAAFGALAFAVNPNVILTPQGTDAASRPAVSVAGHFSQSVQQRGDRLVRPFG